MTNKQTNWKFIDKEGTFRIEYPHLTNDLYFPLVNEAGMMSSVTPMLHGDVKTGHNAFLTTPVSVDDLHNSRSARNFWIRIEGQGVWSATGNSARQNAARFSDNEDRLTVEAGFLWHKLTNNFSDLDLQTEITSLVPAEEDQAELMRVVVTNKGDKTITFTPTAAIPIFGRSADNLRDHRHVTSLLHRTTVVPYGVSVTPTLSFDERGHLKNENTYFVLGCMEEGEPPAAIFPDVDRFIGDGGSLTWPKSVVNHEAPSMIPGETLAGFEAIGGLRFREVALMPGQTSTYIIILAIGNNTSIDKNLIEKYGSPQKFNTALQNTKQHWQKSLDIVSVFTSNPRFNGWMKWVSVQPILRRLFGNSFLPYHDYGRGGRGWRDLWQDQLALLDGT